MTPRERSLRYWTAALLTLFALAGCGGGGGSGASGAPQNTGGENTGADSLAGSWFGTLEDNAGQVHRVRLVIAGARVAAIEVDGIDVGLSGPLGRDDTGVFSAALTRAQAEQVQAVLFVDSAATHFLYVDNFFDFGVLQKDATALAAYAAIDINGNWSGISAFTNFNEFSWDQSSAICITQVCSVTEVDDRVRETFTDAFDSVFGRWFGTSVITLPNGPQVTKVSRAFVTPDKKFLGVWRCLVGADGGLLFPGKCTYSAWRKT